MNLLMRFLGHRKPTPEIEAGLEAAAAANSAIETAKSAASSYWRARQEHAAPIIEDYAEAERLRMRQK